MNDDVEIDLEIHTAQTLEEAYGEWRPIAADRDSEWAWEQGCIVQEFDARESEAILDDLESCVDFSNYWAYLKSRTWSVRAARAKRWGCCARCGKDTPKLDAHHKTYERLGRERPSDLEALCRTCHRETHGLEV